MGWRAVAGRLVPTSAGPEVRRILVGRVVRGFADGFVSVLLAQYLTGLGYSPLRVGAIVTGTLLGSAALTLVFGLGGHRTTPPALLVAAGVLMAATGAAFAVTTSFWPLLVVAVVGTLNPTAGDVSVFAPIEQAYVADHVSSPDRPRVYAVYNLGGALAGALGALGSAVPQRLADANGWDVTDTQRFGFVLYGVAAVVVLALYLRLPGRTWRPARPVDGQAPRRGGLGPARRTVLGLAALFSLDAAGGGFVVTSLLVLWLHLRFQLSSSTTASVFFAVALLGGCSQLLAPVLARRLGLIRTMVFTHLPANVLLVLAAFAPSGAVAIALLLGRALFSSMDVPARQSFVMAVVPPEARAAASSVTNVPRSLASATTPLLAGALLQRTTFGWPLLIAGTTKITYDLLLLAEHGRTPESVPEPPASRSP